MDTIRSYYEKTNGRELLSNVMVGVVTNNNDPQQMGRVQIYIPSLNENVTHVDQDNLPWAMYVSPIGGVDQISSRGPAVDGQDLHTPYGVKTPGMVGYGMWAIPKVGSRVIVVAIDADPNQLCYMGCLFPNSTTHTMPHGRYMTNVDGGENGPDGPYSSTEQPIEPLYSNSKKAFGDHTGYEWRSRGADYSASAISPIRLADNVENDSNDSHSGTFSKVMDDRDTTLTEDNGDVLGKDLTYRQGYALSRSNPDKVTDDQYHKDRDKQTDRNLEPTVFSWSTPGFHAFSMDDRPENCRMRFRTSTGHQMILDDTNERIYISTNEGRNWIEMDSNGHVMVYSQESISMRAEGDINLTSDAKVRITGKDGIHLKSGAEFRVHADQRADMVFEKDLRIHVRDSEGVGSHTIYEKDYLIHNKGKLDWKVDGAVKISFNDDVDLHYGADCRNTIDGDYHINVGGVHKFTSGGTLTINSTNIKVDTTGNMKLTGGIDATGNIKTSGGLQAGTTIYATGAIHSLANVTSVSHSLNSQPVPSPGAGSPVSVSVGTIVSDTSTDASEALQASEAFWTLLTPSHEPWGRNFQANTDNDDVTLDNPTPKNDHSILEFTSNDDPDVGKNLQLDYKKSPTDVSNDLTRKSGDDVLVRNPLWHR
jgi:hypothetical protein